MALPPVGTIIRHTYKGALEYGKVVEGNCWSPVPHVPRGTSVVCGVWKKEVFHPRKTITLREDWTDPYAKVYAAGPPDPAAERAAFEHATELIASILHRFTPRP